MSTFMMNGFEIWFGTTDAPAPSGVKAENSPTITVGFSLDAEATVVTVRYRRAGGAWQRLLLQTAYKTDKAQYLSGKFPDLPAGIKIEYEIFTRCGGSRPQPECKVGDTYWFEIERPQQTGTSVSQPPERIGASVPQPQKSEAANPLKPSPESRSTLKVARLAGLSTDLSSRLASTIPGRRLLNDDAIAPMVTEGGIQDRDAQRLALASIALDLTDDDEADAGKLLKALESRGVEKPQDLTRLTAAEISSTLEGSGVLAPEVAAAKGNILKTIIARAFPTETLMASASLTRMPSVVTEKIRRVLERNSNVDLMRLDLSRGSRDREMLDVSGLTKPEIKNVQLLRGTSIAAGNAETAASLIAANLGSPFLIAGTSLGEIASVAKLNPEKAKNVHNRALKTLGRSSHGFLTLWDALNGGLADMAVGNIRRAKVTEFFDGLDNLQELFGSQDSCQCEHCNSVLGPAAYFVDLMHFVQTHVLEHKFRGLENHPIHLKTRRPDLWVLPLTCENTHTEIPQLQITSEIFENFIAKKRGLTITSDRSNIIRSVYGDFLLAGRHSILQPFQLPLEELEIYLGHFKLRRSDITRLLNQPADIQFRTELSISAIHAALITNPDPSSVNIHDKLGITIPPDGILPMKDLIRATQLSRGELGEVLMTKFVGGQQPLTILAEKESAESVQYDIERIHGVSLGHLDRVHRFLRLKRYLSWSPSELDGFISSAGNSALDTDCLTNVGRAVYLQRRFRANVIELCALVGELPTFPLKSGDDRTPLDILFNVRDLVREDGQYPNPNIRFIKGGNSTEATERSMRLRAGLQLDEAGLTVLTDSLLGAFEQGSGGSETAVVARLFSHRLRHTRTFSYPVPLKLRPLPSLVTLPPSTEISFPISRHNLSLLYRHVVLGRWLKLNPTDLLTLIRLAPNVGNYVRNLADCLAVVEFFDWWKSTPFSLEDLSILLAPPDGIRAQVEELWEALQAWLEAQEGIVLSDTFLTQIDGFNEDLSRRTVSANINTVFESVDDGYRVLASWRDAAILDLSALDGTGISSDAVRELIQNQHPDARLPRALTETLSIEIELARAIVQAALAVENTLTASDFLQSGPMPDKLRGALDSILRLHRLGTGLRLASETLSFLARNQSSFGISNWSEQNPDALRRIASLQGTIKTFFRDRLNVALGETRQLTDDPEKLPDVASSMFNLDPVLIQDLAKTLTLPKNPIDALFKLQTYAETTRKLSVDAVTLLGIVSEEYDQISKASAAVQAGFRAKYPDEKAWEETVGPFVERVLEKKRDGLLDYLLHGGNAVFPDTTEIYKYFLIDGEVDGCFLTSRVVAASSSLQLYVHRIRMNLEKEPGGGLRVDPDCIPDEEWEWRKNYRVWEANRKVFLWPENYLDPTIRDDKTPLFEELESELLQQEITDQTVADAYAKYLRALEELANLRYAGAYHHFLENDDSSETIDVIYLFGATGGDAPTHYWREIRNLALSQTDPLFSPYFGPWQKVDVRIPTRHVSPVVYNGQLHIFWNEITTTSQNATDEGKSRFVGYAHRYVLKFATLRLDGQWTPPERISLLGSGRAFRESDESIDDPLFEAGEASIFQEKVFKSIQAFGLFGVFANPDLLNKLQVEAGLLTPRYGTDVHTKAREGYTLSGFMWERPYLAPEPSYGNRLLINCAGFLVRGAVDLFDRRVLPSGGTRHKTSPTVKNELLAYHPWTDIPTLIGRDGSKLVQMSWDGSPFDYSVASALALNREASVFRRHWGDSFDWESLSEPIANIPLGAEVWAVGGSPNEVIVETEDDLLILLPDANSGGRYVHYRLGTTLVREVARKLFKDGVAGLLSIDYQLGLNEPTPGVSGSKTTDLTYTEELPKQVKVRNPVANKASYGIYYQEIFQHIPLILAHYLNGRGKFEAAQRWYHYVFDPTSPEPSKNSDAPATDRNWKYRQFRGQEQEKLRSVLSDDTAIQKYREDPFNAHAIARIRVSAYQKAVVMRYIDNLLDWADDRFTRFQMESVNEAMMLYLTASEILGPRPAHLGECGEMTDTTRTYDKLKDLLSKDDQFLLEVEELIPLPITTPPTTNEGAVVGVIGQPKYGLSAMLALSGRATLAIEPGISAAPAGDVTIGRSVVSNLAAVSADMPSNPTIRPTFATSAIRSADWASATRSRIRSNPTSDDTMIGLTAAGLTATSIPPVSEFESVPSGISFEAVPFTSVALLPITLELLKTFTQRQDFTFIGGSWKKNGGRYIPPTMGDRFSRAVVRQVTAAFCFPRNEVLIEYWDRVEDRIQKIRTCRDITGRKRKLSLFAPPIDPKLLMRARALGISLDDALSAFEGMIPLYRFSYLIEKAKAFVGTVQAFGSALQVALERKDSEELILLQATQQQQILALTTKAKEWELESAQVNLESNERRRTAVENRRAHYMGLLTAGLNEWEVVEAVATHTASVLTGAAATLEFISAVLHLIPQVGSPFAMKYGGLETGTSVDKIHGGTRALAELARSVASSAGLEARNDRRSEDWAFQRDQAGDELSQIEKQIEAARISRDLAEHAVKVHEKSIEHNEELREYHEDKLSSLGLYTWLASELQRTYREAYNMAYRMARYAEQAYRFEREDYESTLLSGQYWESSFAGLLAGNKLVLGLQYLEQRYIETDQPKRELNDHVFSLRQWNPDALIMLRQTGETKFKVPELFFDVSSPGDYRRRVRTIRVTIPAVTGPYSNIMATLSLDASWLRTSPTTDLTEAPRPRVDSITTSSARNDAGAFELNFHGEKYVPFEGAGAISEWSLSLPTTIRMFDYNTISDVLLHFDYTASFDGVHRDIVQGVTTGLITPIRERLSEEGLIRSFSIKDEFPQVFTLLVKGNNAEISLDDQHLPFFALGASVDEARLLVVGTKDSPVMISGAEFDGNAIDSESIVTDDKLYGVRIGLAMRGTSPWKHMVRLNDISGKVINTYLSLKLVIR